MSRRNGDGSSVTHSAPIRVLTLTNMYPSADEPGFAPFVPEQIDDVRKDSRIGVCDVQFIDGRASTWNYARGLVEFQRRIRAGSYDVIHAHYGLTGAIAITQTKVPVVVTFHGGDVDGPLRSTKWQRQISRLVARRTATNVCVSRRMQPVLRKPSTYLPCGIDLDLFRPQTRSVARDEFGITSGSLAVLFPSSPTRNYKNYPGFLEVVERLRASGQDVHPLALDGFARRDVPTVMAAADVMVLTSTQEGTPVAVMEAMACGLPVVATNVGDVADMLVEAIPDKAFVSEFDASAFAAAVHDLHGRAPATRDPLPGWQRFDGTSIGQALVDIFERCVMSCRP